MSDCVFCGRPIPPSSRPTPPAIRQLYCSQRCATRQQETIRRLRNTSPPEVTARPIEQLRLHDWRCEQSGCTTQAQTWCPLCEKILCAVHDALTPVRRHDCLAGPADAILEHATS